ncbi:MAG: MFS transporter [Planctomycetota bacterium]
MSSPPKSSTGLFTILLTVFLDLVGFSIIFPLFPDMLEYYLGQETAGGWLHRLILQLEDLSGLQGSEAQLAATVLFGGLLGSLYSLLQFIAAPIWGTLSDRRGRRAILIITIGGTALSYVLWVMADNIWILIASRLLGGMMSGNISVATAAVADVTDSSSRAKGMGLIGAAFGIGFIIGPTFGALLSLWDAPASLPWLPGVNPFSGPALFALALAVLNVAFVLRRFPETLIQDTPSTHTRRPLNPLALLRPSPFPGVNQINLLYFVFIAAFAGMEFTLTFLAKDRFEYTAARNGFLFLYLGIIIALVQGGLVRRLAPKYGERNLVIVGTLMVIPGLFVVGLCRSELVMYVGLFLLAAGSSLVTPSVTALVSLYTPADRQGETLGIFRSLGSLARAIAPLIAAGVYWRFGSEWPYYGSALLMLFPLAMAWALPK